MYIFFKMIIYMFSYVFFIKIIDEKLLLDKEMQ